MFLQKSAFISIGYNSSGETNCGRSLFFQGEQEKTVKDQRRPTDEKELELAGGGRPLVWVSQRSFLKTMALQVAKELTKGTGIPGDSEQESEEGGFSLQPGHSRGQLLPETWILDFAGLERYFLRENQTHK